MGESVKAFIQNVHHFRDEAILDSSRPPAEHVAIFDEAQRAWTADQTARFMRQKKGIADFSQSEPEFLLSYMNRHDWAVVVCLVSERYGLLTSSKAQRLKPHAIDVRAVVDPINWFLNARDDTRSSYYLEDAATEFQVQGLELDWTCVAWDADLRVDGTGWSHHDFRGNRWTNVKSLENQRFLRNAYRVLLTRARQGMVIFVPPGNAHDPTRPPHHDDAIDRYLERVGIPQV